MTLMAIFLPVALIWLALTAARTGRVMREQTARLEAAIDALRRAYIDAQNASQPGVKSRVEQKLEEIAAAQRQTESAIAMFSSIRAAAGPTVSEEKPALPLTEQHAGRRGAGPPRLRRPDRDRKPADQRRRFHPRAEFPGKRRGQGRLPGAPPGAARPRHGAADPGGAGRADAAQP
jgi:hypothetical protein